MSAALELRLRLPLDRFELAVELTATRRVTAFFGPSGSGKTSLLEAVAGLRRAHGLIRFAGDAWLDSERRIDLPPERRAVGYVPQDGLLFPHLTVRRNLLAGAGRASRDGRAAADLGTVCELLELAPLLERSVGALSGGERQRVALGRALCSGPRLLLLDEPLAALDLPLRRRLLPFLRRVRSELAVPMLLVTHDPREVQALADEVVALAAGRVVTRGAPRRVLTDPRVFPGAGDEGYENVLPAVLVEHRGAASVVELGEPPGGGPRLVTPRAAGAPGAALLVGVPAREPILALTPPAGVSARNVLAGRVIEVRPLDRLRLAVVELAPGVPPLAVEVTPEACEELGLGPGTAVHVLLKTAGCVLYQ